MDESLKEKIISYIRRNRVSTTEVADCLGKTGVISEVKAVNRGGFHVGRARYLYGYSESNWSIHDQAREVQPGEIVIIDGISVNERALFGELVTKFIVLYKEAIAIVALGNIRDANDIIKNNYPIWCKGFNPVGCFNNNVEKTLEIESVVRERKAYYDDAIVVCDDTGVVVIPKESITRVFYEKLEFIEQQEDIWFDCIDFKKWDTYDTVCLKKYLDNKDNF